MNNHKQACELGEQALSDALEKIDDVDEETFRDAKSIIELLKENLSLWKEEIGRAMPLKISEHGKIDSVVIYV